MSDASPIYFDNNATTKTDPAVLKAMMPYLTEEYGNPVERLPVRQAVRRGRRARARSRWPQLLGCEPKEMLFTSCGTESNNAAINSALTLDPDRQHVVTTRVEHSAIMKHGEWLAKRGVEVTWLGVDEKGQIDLHELERAIRPDTAIVSTMWANNETGVLFPVEEIAAIVHKKRVLFHTDAVQAVGKVPINLAHAHSHINFLSVSGHKLHCPKGVGVLYVNRRTRFNPYLMGGGQEHGKRAGTENVPYIVGARGGGGTGRQAMALENDTVRALRDEFERRVLETIPDTQVNGDREHRLPNTTSIAFEGIDSEAVLLLLDQAGHVLLGRVGLHDRLGASLARAQGDGFLDRACPVEPAVLLQPVQYRGRSGARRGYTARGRLKSCAGCRWPPSSGTFRPWFPCLI